MLTVHLLREGKGPARVVATFFRRMLLDELFAQIKPTQLSYSGDEPPTVARDDQDDDQDLIKVRAPVAVFVHIHDDPSGAFRTGYYILKDVTPTDVDKW
jgi:hypothetical protein